LVLRIKGDKYELIVGERRLRASKFLGLKEVPALIKDIDDQEIAELALVENIQRKNLDYLEEAWAYNKLIKEFSITQKDLAKRVGKSQSTIANKLRLLRLSTDVLERLRSPDISERHARALLKLNDKSKHLRILDEIKGKKLTVRETEILIDKIRKENIVGKKITVFKDLRLFTNTLNKCIKEIKMAGIDIKVEKKELDDYIEFNIRLPKNVN
jgi:ParB family transcriptional regulator, chromosome partitioning protein